MPPRKRTQRPKLPPLVEQKLTKTGYTRGATPRAIFQNRVTRNNAVLIDWEFWEQCKTPDDGTDAYENGFIVLVEPSWYFEKPDADKRLKVEGLELGVNALLIFRRRSDWVKYRPANGKLPNGKPFSVATARKGPLGGIYFARVHATVAEDGTQTVAGFSTKKLRGAGIRVYEYASKRTIGQTKLQLEALLWLCYDADDEMVKEGMSAENAETRRTWVRKEAEKDGLRDLDRLRILRMLNAKNQTICPLCLKRISAQEFLKRGEQAEGRATYDITITDVSLFHIQELRVGKFQHKPYNLGWGHHDCNVVVKDKGIMSTLEWMKQVIENQGSAVDKLPEIRRSVEKAVDG